MPVTTTPGFERCRFFGCGDSVTVEATLGVHLDDEFLAKGHGMPMVSASGTAVVVEP